MLAAAISARPAESPSSPSMRLKAFVTPTIHSTERGQAIHPISIGTPNRCTTGPSEIPSATAMTAPRVWAISFRRAPTDRMSSHIDTSRIGSTPSPRPVARCSGSSQRPAESHCAPPNTRAIEATTASPPRRGIGRSWTLRASGMSIAPTRTASRATSGVNPNARAAATSAGRMRPEDVVHVNSYRSAGEATG